MIKSKFITDILDLLLDGDAEGIAARPQIQYLTDKEYMYTSGGVYIRFSHSGEVGHYKSSKQELILNGVKIQTSEFQIEADATLFFTNGIIDYLETWCYLGDYPNKELTKYTLTQIWNNSPGRQISTESTAEARKR